MNESTFVCLTYIFCLMYAKKTNANYLYDLRKNVFKIFQRCDCVSDFIRQFKNYYIIHSDLSYVRFCRSFVRFISENNDLLGYKSIY